MKTSPLWDGKGDERSFALGAGFTRDNNYSTDGCSLCRLGGFISPSSPSTGYHFGSWIIPNEQFGNKSSSLYTMFVILCCLTVAIS